jgi:hypothetical protein
MNSPDHAAIVVHHFTKRAHMLRAVLAFAARELSVRTG